MLIDACSQSAEIRVEIKNDSALLTGPQQSRGNRLLVLPILFSISSVAEKEALQARAVHQRSFLSSNSPYSHSPEIISPICCVVEGVRQARFLINRIRFPSSCFIVATMLPVCYRLLQKTTISRSSAVTVDLKQLVILILFIRTGAQYVSFV